MSELIDKSVLVGITCVDANGVEVDTFQTFGRIEIDDEHWIGVRREGLSELFGLPPDHELLERASPGTYTVHSSGQQVENPDYVAKLTVTCADLESILTIRGIGFVPRGS